MADSVADCFRKCLELIRKIFDQFGGTLGRLDPGGTLSVKSNIKELESIVPELTATSSDAFEIPGKIDTAFALAQESVGVLTNPEVVNEVKSGMSRTFSETTDSTVDQMVEITRNALDLSITAYIDDVARTVPLGSAGDVSDVADSFAKRLGAAGRGSPYTTVLYTRLLKKAGESGFDIEKYAIALQDSALGVHPRRDAAGRSRLHPIQQMGLLYGMRKGRLVGSDEVDSPNTIKILSHLPQARKSVVYDLDLLIRPPKMIPAISGLSPDVIRAMSTIRIEPMGKAKPSIDEVRPGQNGKVVCSTDGGLTFNEVTSGQDIRTVAYGPRERLEKYNEVFERVVKARMPDVFEKSRDLELVVQDAKTSKLESYLSDMQDEAMINSISESIGSGKLSTEARARWPGLIAQAIVDLSRTGIEKLKSTIAMENVNASGLKHEMMATMYSQIAKAGTTINDKVSLALRRLEVSEGPTPASIKRVVSTVIRKKLDVVEKKMLIRPHPTLKLYLILK